MYEQCIFTSCRKVIYIYILYTIYLNNNFIIIDIFSKIENCYFTINQLINSGISQEDAWNEYTIILTKAAEVIFNLICFIAIFNCS
jgi:hypothetical protein